MGDRTAERTGNRKRRKDWPGSGRAIRALSLIAIVLAAMGPALGRDAMAQGSDEYDFNTGETLAWGGGWELDDELTGDEEGIEMAVLTNGGAGLAVLGLPSTIDMNQTRDLFLEGFLDGRDPQTIDRGDYDNVSYSLDLLDAAGVDMGAFTLFRAGSDGDPTFAYVFFAEAHAFGEHFASAQQSVTLDGSSLFQGVDGQGLEDQLVANLPSSGQDDDTDDPQATAEPDDGDQPPATAEPDEGDQPPATEDSDDAEDGDPGLKGGGEDGDPTAEADQPSGDGETGLVSDTAYVSPQHGVELEWDPSWEVDAERDEPVTSDLESGVDFVALVPADGGALLSVSFLAAGEFAPADVVSVWSSDDFVSENALDANAEVVLSDSSRDIGAVVMTDALQDGTELVIVREVHLVGDTLVTIVFTTTPGSLDGALGAAQDSVSLEGESILQFFSVDEVLESI